MSNANDMRLTRWLPFLAAGLLWLQLFVAAAPTWRESEYYSYGWFVPPLAAFFVWRRWSLARKAAGWDGPGPDGTAAGNGTGLGALGLAAVTVVLLPVVRLVELVDPGWRPPLLLHALVVAVGAHLLLWAAGGRRMSAMFLPVTVFALSAVPYPWQVEQALVRHLTAVVVNTTSDIFVLAGRPVVAMGDRLVMGTEVVGVTEGCSGIRSLQSLLMAALFFGEAFWFGLGRRVALVAVAALAAPAVNILRAYALAWVHFAKGPDAAAAAHDAIGHGAFALAAVILYAASKLMDGATASPNDEWPDGK